MINTPGLLDCIQTAGTRSYQVTPKHTKRASSLVDTKACSGTVHNGKRSPFVSEWNQSDRVGLLYDPSKHMVLMYRNGRKVGDRPAFEDLPDAALYPCIALCHNGKVKLREVTEVSTMGREGLWEFV